MPARVDALVLKVAERCNLKCAYCYMYEHEDRSWLARPKFMDEDTFGAMLDRADEHCARHGHRIDLIFHGGEPLLLGAARLDAYAAHARERLADRLGSLCLQTNATLVDDARVEVLARHGFSVGVSLDGPPETHDRVRVDHGGRGSHAATVRGLRRLRDAGLDPGVLAVVEPGGCGLTTYQHFRSIGIERMNFLLPDVTHDRKPEWYPGLGPTPVADYLIPIFDAWIEEDDPDVRVRVFRHLLSSIMGTPRGTDAFGNPRQAYLVIESDGGIHALDALRVCGEGMDDSGLDVRSAGFDDLELGLPLVHRAVAEGFPLPEACGGCTEVAVCGGGYLPQRWSDARGFDNPSVWCADILKLLAHMRTAVRLAGAAA